MFMSFIAVAAVEHLIAVAALNTRSQHTTRDLALRAALAGCTLIAKRATTDAASGMGLVKLPAMVDIAMSPEVMSSGFGSNVGKQTVKNRQEESRIYLWRCEPRLCRCNVASGGAWMLTDRTVRAIIRGAVFEAHARDRRGPGDLDTFAIANAVFIALKSAGALAVDSPTQADGAPAAANGSGRPLIS
jgi:hypothetical protein